MGVAWSCAGVVSCGKMDGLSLLLIVLAIVIVLVLIAYCFGSPYAEQFNSRLDELTGQDDILSPQLRHSLSPVVFTMSHNEPTEYTYHYNIPRSDRRETILVTSRLGFCATLGDEELTDVIGETNNRQTLVGYLFPREQPITLRVLTTEKRRPTIHIGRIKTSPDNSP